MAFQSSGTKLYSSFITIYGGVSTIIFTTTITASDLSYLEGIATISWPTPATTGLVEYTSDTVPTDPASKYFPHPLPIFIATEVDGVVVNTVGQPIATIIEVQAQPAYMYSAPTAIGTETDCNGDYYICWSEGKKAGVILAVILGGLLFLLFILWFCCFMRIPRSRQSNEEQDHGMTMRHQDQDPDRGGGRRRKHERNSDPDRTGRQGRKRIKRRHSSLSSGSFTEPPKPLPRVVTAQDYREIRRIASVPQNVLGSETSSGSTGRRAVLGVGVRDARRDGILFETAKDRNTAAARNTATTFTAATAPNAAPQARPDLDTPQREIRRDSRHVANVDQQQRGRSPGRNRSTRYRSPRKRRFVLV
jgi:hypothetical protein